MQFSRQEYWWYLFTSLGDFSHPETDLDLTLQADSLLSELPGSPNFFTCMLYKKRHGIYIVVVCMVWGIHWEPWNIYLWIKGVDSCYLFH